MIHLPPLISDLGIILCVAGIVTVIFRALGQPVVLGYLLAGILVGPEVSFLPTVQEKEAIKVWAEIGVIVLLFGLGLEFSFKKLAAVGRGASITAITEITGMFFAGYFIGQVFGWSNMDSLFLGGILSISSTTIIIRAFDELGLRKRRFANLVFGVLIVEDLIAILLLVLLSTIAVTQSFQGIQLVAETARLGFFLTLWFVAGIFLIPGLMRKVRPLMNRETSLVFSLGLCLLMVMLATSLGFSPALGAFIMGSIFAETPDGERIEHGLESVRDLFAAIFFVSVGMLIELEPLKEHWVAVVVITLVTIAGKVLSSAVGALISGQSLKHSVQAGMSLAQIGEFSFIIATLGLSLKVISDFIYPIAVAVSTITTFTTPYLIRWADPLYFWLDRKLPAHWRSRLEPSVPQFVSGSFDSGLQSTVLRILVNGILVIGISLASSHWLYPRLIEQFGTNTYTLFGTLGITVLVCLPFYWAIGIQSAAPYLDPSSPQELSQVTSRALLSFAGRSALSMILLAFTINLFTSTLLSLFIVISLALIVGFFGYKNFGKIYQSLENQFLSHLNEKELAKLREAAQRPQLAPWDAHLSEVEVDPDSAAVGKTLIELALREKLGVTLALIERGSRKIMAPRRDELIMPKDRIYVIGTDEQIAAVSKLFGADPSIKKNHDGDFGLGYLSLENSPQFSGKTIRESGVREATEGLIVGVERGGVRILNPDSNLTLQQSDRLWIVGKQDLIALLNEESPISPS